MAKLSNRRVLVHLQIAWLCLLTSAPAYSDQLPLWELESDRNQVMVMGSVHFLRASDYPLPAGLDVAYESADILVMEIKLDELDPIATQGVLMSMGVNSSGKSLADMIGADAYREATERANKVGIPIAMFGQFEPWFAALSISQMRMLQLGFDSSWGIETTCCDTVTSALADAPPAVAVIVVEPFDSATTVPAVPTVATLSADDSQTNSASVTSLPPASLAVAVKLDDSPKDARFASDGVIVTEATCCDTVTSALPDASPAVAVIVVLPSATTSTDPFDPTIATPSADDFHRNSAHRLDLLLL